MPDVLLRLWVEFSVSGGIDPIGLDLPSILASSNYCRSKGYYYNGDVAPDYLEAWIYQAALSHGLSASRSRLGIALNPIVVPGAPASLLITFGNAANITQSWAMRSEDDESLQLTIKTNDRDCCEPYTPVGTPWIDGSLVIEELLGVRPIDMVHITDIENLIIATQKLTKVLEFVFKGDRGQGFDLSVGQVIQSNTGNLTSRSGNVVSGTSTTITPTWDSVIMSGYTDSIGASNLTDLSKKFLGIATIGDILLVQNSSGQEEFRTITAVSEHTITIGTPFTSVPLGSGYKIFDMTPDPVDLLSIQDGGPIVNVPLLPIFDPIAKKVTYKVPNPIGRGASIAVGKPSYYRIETVAAANVTAIGLANG